jgi:hypothetical protein
MPARALVLGSLVALTALPALAPDAGAATTHTCKSADLRYPFTPGGHNDFGVFKLRITGGRCATAHRVAKAWQTTFEANLKAGDGTLPKSVLGFAFKTLPAHAAQTYNERGRRHGVTIRFDYVVPNG